MAIEKKKMKDPAEAALSAVEQALTLDETFVLHTPARSDGKERKPSVAGSNRTIALAGKSVSHTLSEGSTQTE